MRPIDSVVLSLAYILGLLGTGVPGGGMIILLLGIGAAIGRWQHPRWPWLRMGRLSPTARVWLLAGVIGFLGSLYFQMRLPQPGLNDISRFIPAPGNGQEVVTVQGRVERMPRLTRSQRGQVWLRATQLRRDSATNESAPLGRLVTGKLYVTLPAAGVRDLHPHQKIAVTGTLYRPKPAASPEGFDFKAYLKQEGVFAGLRGLNLKILDQGSTWGWWAVRQRIATAQARWLGTPEGPLVSAMVLGSRAVNIPWQVRDQFTQVGLAHALAASGFQTSLLLAIVLALSRGCSKPERLGLGIASLGIFASLSGFEPSVLRATIMGIAGLIALVRGRQLRSAGVLLATAVLLLLFNPLWIWDLGFQLSFLATLGLIVTVPGIVNRLDWLPPAIAPLIAVPVAAFIWTLPLQLFTFGSFAPYSILVNLITSPLISGVTIGGVISSVTALIWPLAGSALAWLLYYPSHLLLELVQLFAQLPASTVATGTISIWQLGILYGLLGLTLVGQWWQDHWRLTLLIALGLVMIPAWQVQRSGFQATILAETAVPIMVIQEQGTTTLINIGDQQTAKLTVLPFLRQAGINQIDWAIATDTWLGADSGWLELLPQMAIATVSNLPKTTPRQGEQQILTAIQSHAEAYQPLQPGQTLSVASTQAGVIRTQPLALKLQIGNLNWLLLNNLKLDQQTWVKTATTLARPQVLWWSGEQLPIGLVKALQPQVVIATSSEVAAGTISQLAAAKIPLYWTPRDGAIRWTPQQGFEKLLDAGSSELAP